MTQLHYEVFGSGPPLVMLHGWAMHGGVWRDFAWRLGQHYQVILIDLPGHGFSDPLSPFDLAHLSQVLLREIPADAFSLLGWSLGATVALALAERFPERIQRLFILSGNPCFMETADWPGMGAESFAAFSALLDRGVPQTLSRFLALQVNGLLQSKGYLQVLRQTLPSRPSASEETLRAGLRLLQQSDFRDLIQQSSLPMTFILGDQDQLVPIALAQRLRQLNQGLSVVVIEHAGHTVFLSHVDLLVDSLLRAY